MEDETVQISVGAKVRDQFGNWTLKRDPDGVWSAVQQDCEILLLDDVDWARFGIQLSNNTCQLGVAQ